MAMFQRLDVSTFGRFSAGPKRVLGVVEVAVGMGHEPEDSACFIAQAGDARDAAVGVGGVPVGSAGLIHVAHRDPATLCQFPCHGVTGGQHFTLGMLDGHFQKTPPNPL